MTFWRHKKAKSSHGSNHINKSEGQEFVRCVYCYDLWQHFLVCSFKPESTKPGKTRVQAFCAFAEPVPPGFNDAYWKFLSIMNQDRIAVAIKEEDSRVWLQTFQEE